jgi:hypothetical protein
LATFLATFFLATFFLAGALLAAFFLTGTYPPYGGGNFFLYSCIKYIILRQDPEIFWLERGSEKFRS